MAESSINTSESTKISVQDISLPKGGGAITGLGDTFQPNLFSGTGNFSVPLPVTAARGLEPQLTLNYNSGSGNSEFGMGFSLSVSGISIRTGHGTPEYMGSEVYILEGAGELTLLKKTDTVTGYLVFSYAPRVEGLFAKIERWFNISTGISYWKIITSENITTSYGTDKNSCISNPANDQQIFKWLPVQTIDAKGNKINYTYAEENSDNVPVEIFEVNRLVTANRYLTSINYGNFLDENNIEQFAFEVVFDYGEYELSGLDQPNSNPYQPVRTWACRPDSYSSYVSAFEIRTYRLCRNVLLFHKFTKELGLPCLVKRVALQYNNLQQYDPIQVSTMSMLNVVVSSGYRKKADGSYNEQQLPALQLTYSAFNPSKAPQFNTLNANDSGLPGYLGPSAFLPVDLNGDGLPGFLLSNTASTMYFEPMGDGNYLAGENCNTFPLNKDLGSGEVSLTDIDGNGQLELLVSNTSQSGFYQYTDKGNWDNFQAFQTYPLVLDPETEMTDLDANGKTDFVLVGEQDLLTYYSKGKSGFSAGKRTQKPLDFPLKSSGDPEELVTFVNIFGDGLSHRVRVKSGLVECWPNLGYGNFSKKITLAGAPVFDEVFDNSRFYFADIDGSGTADMVYAYSNRVDIFINQNGNSFSDPIQIILPEEFGNLDSISFADILGNGTSCLVFTKIAPLPRHYYYNFVGETVSENGTLQKIMKPYLLCEIDNNLGTITQTGYCSSTKFALADKAAGRPWVTKLRFPVQVVEETIVIDKISNSRSVSRFKYHDGYYDPIEREFRGFGFVESWDSETFQQYEQSQSNPQFPSTRINEELYVPPVYTKTWYCTGAFKERNEISTQYKAEYFNKDTVALNFPENVFAPEILTGNEETFRQAYVALKGTVMRTEVYADDQTKVSSNPYTVEASNYEVVLLKEASPGDRGVFLVNPRESISYNYERNPDDPQVKQEFVLEVDLLSGKTIKSCGVFLSRRSNSSSDVIVYPEQQSLKATASKTLYIDTADDLPYRYRGIPYDQQSFELLGLTLPAGDTYFSYDEMNSQGSAAFGSIVPYLGTVTPGTLQMQQLSWSQSFYWNDDQSNFLLAGFISERALVHHRSNACFTEENIAQVFGTKLTNESIQNDGGYFLNTDTGYWHNNGLVQYYFETTDCFYMPNMTENSFADPSGSLYQKTTVNYDAYYLNATGTTQYIDASTSNVITAIMDYQAMKPYQMTDINGNISEVLFDGLGQVIVSSLFGKENGVAMGGMTLYEYNSEPAEYIVRELTSEGLPINFDDVLTNSEYYLQGAASYFFYDLNVYSKARESGTIQPVNAITLVRENYYYLPVGKSTFSCQTSIEYSNGSGQSIEKKQQVDPGLAIIRDAEGNLIYTDHHKVVTALTDTRWLVSGRTVYNNKEKACEVYLPYFSNTPYYETQDEIVNEKLVPPPTVTHYDPLLRVIRMDTPKGFFSTSEFTPWEEILSDTDDTVNDSAYYISFMANYPTNPTQEQKDEKDALDKASLFYKTPGVSVKDNTGSPFLAIQNLVDKPLTSYIKTDILGRTLQSIDARLYQSNLTKGTAYYNFNYLYAMGEKTPWYTDSVDAGTSRFFNNMFGNTFQSWNARNFNTILTYDGLQRPLQTQVKAMDSSGSILWDCMVEKIVYGERIPNANQQNLRGQVCKHSDQSGITHYSSYGLQGTVLSVVTQMTTNYKTTIDWTDPLTVPMEPEIYTVNNTFDALKRVVTQTTPDLTITTNTYNLAGLLKTVSLTYQDQTQQALVNRIDYNANAQRTLIQYANGVTTNYFYEDTTQRLNNLYSTRPDPVKPILQNIHYFYDPVGNITRKRDKSAQTVFCNNQQVDPLSDYTYNAIYQLLQADGRQHPGINSNTYVNGFKQSIYGDLCPPDVNDETKLEKYTEYYSYDDGGNLISKRHVGVSTLPWTQSTLPFESNNRLIDFAYDTAGNQQSLQLNGSVALYWDYQNRLSGTGIIQRPGQEDDADYYNYKADGTRARKVSERSTNGGSVKEVHEKIYLGNFEIKKIKTISSSGDTILLNRESLRVMDGSNCLTTMLYWLLDAAKREVDQSGTRSLRFQMDDSLGSVSLEMDVNAQIISYEEYFPFGGTAIIAGSSQQEVKLKDYRYSGKECDDTTGLYYYGARYYISWLGRWLNPDPTGPVDGLNLYTFVKNNPVTGVDVDGRWFLVPMIIGAAVTAYTSYQVASSQGYSGWQLAAATVGGGVLGATTGQVGGLIASSAIPMAQTISMAVTSTVTSVALSQASGGAVDKTTSFGALSYNWSQGTLTYPLKQGNSTMTNLSLIVGATANTTDLRAGFSGTNVDLVTEFDLKDGLNGNPDLIGHSALVNKADGINVSVGPVKGFFNKNQPVTGQISDLTKVIGGRVWNNYHGTDAGWIIPLYNVNRDTLFSISENLRNGLDSVGNPLSYSGLTNSCVGHASDALFRAGVPTPGSLSLHPFLLHLGIGARHVGIQLNPFQTLHSSPEHDRLD